MADKSFPLSVVISAVDKITAPMRRISQQISAATRPVQKLKQQFLLLSKESGLSHMGAQVGALTQKLILLGTAGAAAFAKFTRDVVTSGDDIAETARKIGISGEALQKWRYAGEQAGLTVEEVDNSFKKFSATMGQMKAKTGALYTFLMRVNPAWADQMLAVEGNEAGMREYLKIIRSVNDEQKQAALSAAAFGRGGGASMKLLAKMSDSELTAYMDKLEQLGGVMSEEQLKATEAADESFRNLGVTLIGARNRAMLPLIPVITKLSDQLTDFLSKNKEEVAKKIAENFEKIAVAAKDIWASFKPLIAAATWLFETFGAGNAVLLLLAANFALMASPLGLMVAAFLAGWVAGKKLYEWLQKYPKVLSAIGAIFEVAIVNPVVAMIGAFKLLWGVVTGAFGAMIETVNYIKSVLPSVIDYISSRIMGSPIGLLFKGASAVYNFATNSGGGDTAAQSASRGQVDVNISGQNLPYGMRIENKAAGTAKINSENLGYLMPFMGLN